MYFEKPQTIEAENELKKKLADFYEAPNLTNTADGILMMQYWYNESTVLNVYKNYFRTFFEKLKPEVKKKFLWTFRVIATIDKVFVKYFKHLEGTNSLYEVRVEVGSDIYKVFCFFDKGKLIILLNGFQKKSQKTPKNKIDQAEKLKKQYFNEKES